MHSPLTSAEAIQPSVCRRHIEVKVGPPLHKIRRRCPFESYDYEVFRWVPKQSAEWRLESVTFRSDAIFEPELGFGEFFNRVFALLPIPLTQSRAFVH